MVLEGPKRPNFGNIGPEDINFYQKSSIISRCCIPTAICCPPVLKGSHECIDPISTAIDAADFYALIPTDNSGLIQPGKDLSFPKNGPTSGGGIYRINDFSFNLTSIGIYKVSLQVSLMQTAQLVLTLNDEELPSTVAESTSEANQAIILVLVQTTTENSVLTVRNPKENNVPLTIAPNRGKLPASAHLIIMRTF